MSPTSRRSAVKLVIGPDNTAGQAFRWAESCRTYEGVESVSFAGSRRSARRIDGPSHRRALHHRVRPTLLKTTWARFLLRNATHFLNESFSTITGDRRTESLNRDLPWLRDVGISVGVLFHGSDIRSPSRHMDSQPSSYFRIMEPQMVSSMEESTSRNRQLARESGLPLFVSTPDLLLDLPEATWRAWPRSRRGILDCDRRRVRNRRPSASDMDAARARKDASTAFGWPDAAEPSGH